MMPMLTCNKPQGWTNEKTKINFMFIVYKS